MCRAPARGDGGVAAADQRRRRVRPSRVTEQINFIVLDPDWQGFQAFTRAGAEHAFPGLDQKARIVHRALDQRALDIEKLVIDPVQR